MRHLDSLRIHIHLNGDGARLRWSCDAPGRHNARSGRSDLDDSLRTLRNHLDRAHPEMARLVMWSYNLDDLDDAVRPVSAAAIKATGEMGR